MNARQEERPLQQQEDPQPPHIKEEKEDLWVTQEEAFVPGQEEADLTKFPLTVVSVKTEEHEDKPPESSQLHHSPNSASEEHRGIQTMKATLLDAIHTRFDHVETEPLYAVATMLDPRYKDNYMMGEEMNVTVDHFGSILFFTSSTNLDQAKEALKVEVMKMEQELKTMPTGEGVAKAETARQTPGMEAGSSTSSLGRYFDEILEESSQVPQCSLHKC
ncbi:uncharacterized protein LOC133545337 isoform X2 [Nerophis ophidion]|uniref:uncharacterized protein LOC133545337 isoform X2 n=1 Tax=Nerophis ophidion TaxID=159077 RepID=UPI002AE043E2|nr:uncharacterized protein LOC133545337 isoform X2 [Nerophis ophidion]